ncbi:MAG: redoxin family protein [Candidatus Dadabacteria bacterium]|nr:redoxin family protein [Candidatus Dadabacteria bacterium]NIQ16353.1 redoxin family protein [Candidatus Dadabacteria bacterium]
MNYTFRLIHFFLILFIFGLIASCNNSTKNNDKKTAKDFNLTSITEGNKFTLNDLNEKPLVLNFWASWCAPCREEMPFLENSWKQYKNKDVNIVGINVMDDKTEALKTLNEFGISYLNLYDSQGRSSGDYGIIALPVTIFIDKEGNISQQQYGPFLGKEGENTFHSYIKEILK